MARSDLRRMRHAGHGNNGRPHFARFDGHFHDDRVPAGIGDDHNRILVSDFFQLEQHLGISFKAFQISALIRLFMEHQARFQNRFN
ncbi:hypothetical protein D1872_312840 [compost metagenome]